MGLIRHIKKQEVGMLRPALMHVPVLCTVVLSTGKEVCRSMRMTCSANCLHFQTKCVGEMWPGMIWACAVFALIYLIVIHGPSLTVSGL